jgi:hypothetical protein
LFSSLCNTGKLSGSISRAASGPNSRNSGSNSSPPKKTPLREPNRLHLFVAQIFRPGTSIIAFYTVHAVKIGLLGLNFRAESYQTRNRF